MKLYIHTTLLFVLLSSFAMGQSEYDALNFSQFLPSGTARYTAMGGAYSALGADMSSMATNPAGTGLYRKSEIGFSTAWTNHNITSNYYSAKREARELSFQLTNMGFITVNQGAKNSDWKSINVGFAYNQLNDYNKSYSIAGGNSVSSMLDKQVEILNNSPGDSLNNAYYKANVIFHEDNAFYNDYNYGGSYYGSNQVHQVRSSGYAGEYDLNFSGNYLDKFYLGATLGFQRINYSNYTYHMEEATKEMVLKDFSSQDYLDAKGSGFNLKLGMLYKVSHELRIGAAFHTPTVYNIKYNYRTDVSATLNFDGVDENYTGKSPRGNYNWNFISPAKFILSSALLVGKMGIISGEIEYMDYSSMNISASDYFFDAENENIKKIYKGTLNARMGAEVKLGLASLRFGAAYFASPYKSGEPNADASKLLLSGGVGIHTGSVFFDATYQHISYEEMYYMYGYESSGVALSNNSNKFMATLGFRF